MDNGIFFYHESILLERSRKLLLINVIDFYRLLDF